MTTRAVLVALLVAASGCQVLGGGGGPGTPTATATPAPVPTATATTPDPSEFPPGVSRDGAVDTVALARAHLRAVVGTSYVWRERWRTTFGKEGAPPRVSGWQLRLVNGTYYHVETVTGRAGGFEAGTERFADGEHRYDRRDRGNGTDRYAVFPASNASIRLASRAADSIRAFLALSDATVTAVRVDGERHYEITTRSDVYEPVDAYNYTARAVVDPSGFVKRLAVSYATEPGAAGTDQRYSFAYRQVENATVRAPDWVDDARAQREGVGAADEPGPPSRTPVAVYLSNADHTPNGTTTPDRDSGASTPDGDDGAGTPGPGDGDTPDDAGTSDIAAAAPVGHGTPRGP